MIYDAMFPFNSCPNFAINNQHFYRKARRSWRFLPLKAEVFAVGGRCDDEVREGVPVAVGEGGEGGVHLGSRGEG